MEFTNDFVYIHHRLAHVYIAGHFNFYFTVQLSQSVATGRVYTEVVGLFAMACFVFVLHSDSQVYELHVVVNTQPLQ